MSHDEYYGKNFEGALITGLAIVILLSMLGAWKLMSRGLHECRASDYTYCGETSAADHHSTSTAAHP